MLEIVNTIIEGNGQENAKLCYGVRVSSANIVSIDNKKFKGENCCYKLK
jgi:hypothetical protein